MRPYIANLIYGILLVALSLWAYLASEDPSGTAFIPMAFGVALLALTPGIKKENRTLSHIAIALTVLVLAGLVKPLTGALGRADTMAMARVLVMMAGGVIALVVYFKQFMDVRKSKRGK
jgi:uncharacterized protein YhhL (DUF1145 family)